MPAVAQHTDMRYTNSRSDPEILSFFALHFTLKMAILLLPLCLQRKLQEKQGAENVKIQ